jgi:carboxylate-amine ligase
VAGSVLADADGLEAELQQQQIEIGTQPCRTLTELADQLRHWRTEAANAAERAAARIVATGTCPLPVVPELTVEPRYRAMVETYGLTTAEQLTCGCHVHVGVESDDEGVAALDRIRVWLPVILALTVNSPFWQGVDSGYASFRSQAWTRLPTAGPTGVFGSAERYHAEVDRLLRTGVALDLGMIYFDARLSHHLPTVRWAEPAEFDGWKRLGESLGIGHVEASPLTRSSYHAKQAAATAVPVGLTVH